MELNATRCCNLHLHEIGAPAKNTSVPLTDVLLFRLAAKLVSAKDIGSNADESRRFKL